MTIIPARLAVFSALLLFSSICLAEASQTEAQAALAARCAALNSLDLEGLEPSPARIVETRMRVGEPASQMQQVMFKRRGHSQGIPTPGLEAFPDHCSVEGYVTPQVRFRLALPPPDVWNGRFMLAACDAWCGKLHDEIVVPGLNRGYATVTNDGGHYSRAPFDGIWAHQNIPARIDFAHRANHVTAQAAKAIIEAYYGEPPKFSYITGFSKGGNAGLFSALKYPEDFDGVFAKAPVPYYQWKNTAHFHWIAMAVHPDGKTPVMTAEKVALVRSAIVEACDGLDGLRDGVIDDPRVCQFDAQVLACQAGQSTDKCLTPEQVESVRLVYTNPVTKDGLEYYPYGLDAGSETDWGAAIYPAPGGKEEAYSIVAARTGLRYMAFADNPGASYDWTRFDYPAERERLKEMEAILDPSGSDMEAFKERGGKLMVVHGWSDALVSARMSIDWFEALQEGMGGADKTADFAQLYLVPGMHHGSGGPGPYEFDAFSALERWVEDGQAPEQLLMRDEPGAPEKRSRPAFPYPDRAVYDGHGDPSDASSFTRSRDGWLQPKN